MDAAQVEQFLRQRLEPADALVRQLQGSAVHLLGDPGEPTLQGTWVNNDSGTTNTGTRRAGYFKLGRLVCLVGVIKSGAVPSNIFTLPEGFRPYDQGADHAVHQPVASNSAFGLIQVSRAGVVNLAVGSAVWVDLSAVKFLAA